MRRVWIITVGWLWVFIVYGSPVDGPIAAATTRARAGRFTDAVNGMERSVMENVPLPDARYWFVRCSLRMRGANIHTASKIFPYAQSLVIQFPESAWAWLSLAETQYAQGDFIQAAQSALFARDLAATARHAIVRDESERLRRRSQKAIAVFRVFPF